MQKYVTLSRNILILLIIFFLTSCGHLHNPNVNQKDIHEGITKNEIANYNKDTFFFIDIYGDASIIKSEFLFDKHIDYEKICNKSYVFSGYKELSDSQAKYVNNYLKKSYGSMKLLPKGLIIDDFRSAILLSNQKCTDTLWINQACYLFFKEKYTRDTNFIKFINTLLPSDIAGGKYNYTHPNGTIR